ncbi:hypothetical protein BD779DRAFT_1678436 [Infundibulicybe gibba]|nr:hypothetical protein BD779DRAFT_1678436 [Infundibulicybe gibba]
MNHPNSITQAVATTATPSAGAPTPAELAAWVKSLAEQYGIPEQRLIDGFHERYGGNDSILKAKIALDETERAMAEGVRLKEGSSCPLQPYIINMEDPTPVGRVVTSDIGNDIKLRMWGSPQPGAKFFLFDFINAAGDHAQGPPGMKIYSESFRPNDRVLSIGQSIAAIPLYDRPHGLEGFTSEDPSLAWGTYLIPEGVKLRIEQPGRKVIRLTTPRWRAEEGNTTIPEYW